MYHPDVMASQITEGKGDEEEEDVLDRFVEVKEAFDKLVELND